MNEYKHALLIAIAEKGTTDLVMDAAKSAGAMGGTIVHAKSVFADEQHKFFGLSIADEKEVVYIVAKQRDKESIMKAIMSNAGMNTPAKAAVLSLPIDAVAGLRSVTDDE